MSKNWAICIGINEYYNLTPLQYAVSDATAVRDFFLQEVAFEQVFYFSDDSPPIDTPNGPMRSLPTYANLKRFFRERFQQQFLTDGDNFWFFFAGHGELHEGHDYLMPIDVDPGAVDETALRISDITASLRNSGADNTVLLLDACRSQGQRSTVGFGSEAQKGIVTIYSCSPRQKSYEIEELQHGVFTHALLEGFGLLGANSCATVQRIDQYLRHQVPSLNAKYKKPIQTPYTAVEPLSKNCLILLPQRARLEDVQALKLAAYKAEKSKDWDLAQQLWVRTSAASSGTDQDAIEAFGRIALERIQHPTATPLASTIAGTRSLDAPVSEPVERVTPTQPKVSPAKESRQETLGQGVFLELVRVPGGRFQMGSPAGQGRDRERPQHEVTVSSFLMGKYLVTQAQWRAVSALPKVSHDMEPDPSRFKGDNRPVERVSWDDAVEFCQRLSRHSGRDYRLPSEAEWEYACRAGTTTRYSFGDSITGEQVNCDFQKTVTVSEGFLGFGRKTARRGTYLEKTTEVGNFPANRFGLYDMHGNVWEWCQDPWHESYEGAPKDGSAWTEGGDASQRMLRGGSWFGNPDGCRSAYRFRDARDYGFNDLGFRVICASSWTLE
ncbi:MAG: SUMF1/EgtB/PvdO family nonheme iron enzyme [Cyanobacteria bacterium J06632_3]